MKLFAEGVVRDIVSDGRLIAGKGIGRSVSRSLDCVTCLGRLDAIRIQLSRSDIVDAASLLHQALRGHETKTLDRRL